MHTRMYYQIIILLANHINDRSINAYLCTSIINCTMIIQHRTLCYRHKEVTSTVVDCHIEYR